MVKNRIISHAECPAVQYLHLRLISRFDECQLSEEAHINCQGLDNIGG